MSHRATIGALWVCLCCGVVLGAALNACGTTPTSADKALDDAARALRIAQCVQGVLDTSDAGTVR